MIKKLVFRFILHVEAAFSLCKCTVFHDSQDFLFLLSLSADSRVMAEFVFRLFTWIDDQMSVMEFHSGQQPVFDAVEKQFGA